MIEAAEMWMTCGFKVILSDFAWVFDQKLLVFDRIWDQTCPAFHRVLLSNMGNHKHFLWKSQQTHYEGSLESSPLLGMKLHE